MEATNITFLKDTYHREERGGYEQWSFKIDEKEYKLFCDLRIPGTISSFYEGLPEDTNKVIVVDIIFTTNNNATEIYNPVQSSFELQNTITDTVIKILLEKIKPKRDFKYVAFVYSLVNELFYKNIVNKICNDVSDDIKRKMHRIINPEIQLLIDAGQWKYLIGEIK